MTSYEGRLPPEAVASDRIANLTNRIAHLEQEIKRFWMVAEPHVVKPDRVGAALYRLVNATIGVEAIAGEPTKKNDALSEACFDGRRVTVDAFLLRELLHCASTYKGLEVARVAARVEEDVKDDVILPLPLKDEIRTNEAKPESLTDFRRAISMPLRTDAEENRTDYPSLSAAAEETIAQSVDDFDGCRICGGRNGSREGHEDNCAIVMLREALLLRPETPVLQRVLEEVDKEIGLSKLAEGKDDLSATGLLRCLRIRDRVVALTGSEEPR